MRKKKSILILILYLIIIFPLFSNNIKLGLLSGLDITNSHVINKPNGISRYYYPMISYNLNGYFEFVKSEKFTLTLEPGFIRKGGIMKGENNVRIQLNYIQIPVLIDYYLNDIIYLSIGPEISRLLNSNIKVEDFIGITYYDIPIELSGIIGFNCNLTNKIDVGFRYNHGITYVKSIEYTNQFGDLTRISKEYNQYFQILLKYKIK